MISLNSATPKEKKPGQKAELEIVKKTEKDLDEFRKAKLGPQVMSDDGKELNPYIPHFISAVPWFYKTDKPTLRQHSDPCKNRPSLSDISESYIKGIPTGEVPTKFKKGSCENCGSSSHKRKDCLERPRKIGAKYSNKDLRAADYVQPNLRLDYEGKRDRWAGYNPDDYQEVVEEFNIIEKTKEELKTHETKEIVESGNFEQGNEPEEDEDKYAESSNMVGTKFDENERGTVRNLRIREDTAKYLFNLDNDSAFYDPKSRSMRDNPLVGKSKGEFISFKGDDVHRVGEQMNWVSEATNFTLSAHDKGIDVHLLTDPTKSELLMKQFNARKEALQNTQQKELLSRYGGEEHFQIPAKEVLFDQTDNYVEYSRDGKVLKGLERATISSKYDEDVFIKNHTSVWGSYWHDFQWGYACCHSFIKNSYCVGMIFEPMVYSEEEEEVSEEETEALKRSRGETSEENAPNKKKSKYHVFHDVSFPTEKEMEEYHMKKTRLGDPMANFKPEK